MINTMVYITTKLSNFGRKIKDKIYCRIIPKGNHKFYASEFRQQVRKTVKMTSIGIRDFGIFLSGGLDSSIIAYEMNKINSKTKTFTNRFATRNGEIDRGYNSDANVASISVFVVILLSPKIIF